MGSIQMIFKALLAEKSKIENKQLLQLCTARIVWSDSVIRSASVRLGN